MARKPQQQNPLQPSEVAPEVTPVVTDVKPSASPVTKAVSEAAKVVELPNGVIIKTY